jgi:hypothetical protein
VVEKARAKYETGVSCADLERGCFSPRPPSAASFQHTGGEVCSAPAWRPQLGTETGQCENCEATGECQMDEETQMERGQFAVGKRRAAAGIRKLGSFPRQKISQGSRRRTTASSGEGSSTSRRECPSRRRESPQRRRLREPHPSRPATRRDAHRRRETRRQKNCREDSRCREETNDRSKDARRR